MRADTRIATYREIAPGFRGSRRFQVDCRHGTTTADLLGEMTVAGLLDLLIARHEREERCGCAAALRPWPPEGARS